MGISSQSISPERSAFTAVCASGMMRHSTWSISARLAPATELGASSRGT